MRRELKRERREWKRKVHRRVYVDHEPPFLIANVRPDDRTIIVYSMLYAYSCSLYIYIQNWPVSHVKLSFQKIVNDFCVLLVCHS